MQTKLKKLLFTSWWLFPVFLVIPVFTVLNLRLHLPVSGDLLLINNGCFALVAAARFVWYLMKSGAAIRYGADRSMPKKAVTVDRPASELQGELSGAGYRFGADGRYGEKREHGYFGTTAFYFGLMLLLVFGSYDYMREYSIMVRLGVGLPFELDGKGLTGDFEAGKLAATSAVPQLQVIKQILPNDKWPKGATEIALVTKEGKEVAKTTLSPGKTFNHDGLEYRMTKFIFDGLVVIREGKYIIFDEFIKFLPLAEKKGVYSYYAPTISVESKVRGSAWLNPEKKTVRVVGKLGKQQIVDTELELWGVNKKTEGEYKTSFEGLAHWSEIRVSRGRHRGMLMLGAFFVVMGGLLRLFVRPQRVWLEEEGASSLVRVCGAQTERLLGLAGKK